MEVIWCSLERPRIILMESLSERLLPRTVWDLHSLLSCCTYRAFRCQLEELTQWTKACRTWSHNLAAIYQLPKTQTWCRRSRALQPASDTLTPSRTCSITKSSRHAETINFQTAKARVPSTGTLREWVLRKLVYRALHLIRTRSSRRILARDRRVRTKVEAKMPISTSSIIWSLIWINFQVRVWVQKVFSLKVMMRSRIERRMAEKMIASMTVLWIIISKLARNAILLTFRKLSRIPLHRAWFKASRAVRCNRCWTYVRHLM